MTNSAAHDDELAAQMHTAPVVLPLAFDAEYTAPGHVMPLAIAPGVFGGGGMCNHTFELQSLRMANAELLAQVDNLTAERDSLLARLELAGAFVKADDWD